MKNVLWDGQEFENMPKKIVISKITKIYLKYSYGYATLFKY